MALWSGMGINYGALQPYSSATAEADLTYFQSLGIKNIRVAAQDYSNTGGIGFTDCLDICQRARNHGFTRIIWGATAGGTGITSSNVSAFRSGILTMAGLAQSSGNVDEFQIGNEETLAVDGTTITKATIITDLLSWVAAIKAVFPGTLSYATNDGGDMYLWITAGKGSLDKISVNNYGYDPTLFFTTRAKYIQYCVDWFNAFGSNGYLSEWNIESDSGWWDITDSIGWPDLRIRDEIAFRYWFARNTGLASAFFYTYTTGGDEFAAKFQSGNFRSAWPSLIGQRPWFFGVPNVSVPTDRSTITRSTITRSTSITRSPF